MDNDTIRKLSRMPEYQSIEAFIDDNETGSFTHQDLNVLNYVLRIPIGAVKEQLEGYGLWLQLRDIGRSVRGVHSNSNDRWSGPGSCQSHGGSGSDQITGFAGRKG